MLEERIEDIEAEAIDAAPKPGLDHVHEGGADGRLTPVQVRLLGQERVQVELSARLVPGPGRSTEE